MTLFSNKIDIIPSSLSISKDSLWQLINKVTSVLIVDVNDLIILFANPNSLKELRIIEQNNNLTISDVIGKPFKYPITYGEKNQFILRTLDNYDALIEVKCAIVTWRNSPSYLLTINSFISKCENCKTLREIS